MKNLPLVSVILPTYNGERFLTETLQSVLDQTYKNLEIIITDDCSTDNTVKIIKSFKDERIKFYQNEHNLGIAENTNIALKLATGKYIMMQDHDDISMPVRAEMMVKYLETHPDIAVCGSRVYKIKEADDNYVDDSEPRVAMDNEELEASDIFDRLIFHPTVIYRREILAKLDKPYSGEFKIVSDDDFFHRLNIAGAKWCFLDNKYLKYREYGGNTAKRNRKLHYIERKIMIARVLKYLLPFATDDDIKLHALVQCYKEPVSFFGKYSDWCVDWFERIIKYNLDTNRFNHEKLLKVMGEYWHWFVTISNSASPFKALKVYRSIDVLNPYLLSNRNFFKQWLERFFRSIRWKFIRNKNLS